MKMLLKSNWTVLIGQIVIIGISGSVLTLPWWSFVIPIAILGSYTRLARMTISFPIISFFSGFIVWSGLNFLKTYSSNNIIFDKTAILFNVPKLIVIGISGCLAGLLTFISFHIGYHFLKPNYSSDQALDDTIDQN